MRNMTHRCETTWAVTLLCSLFMLSGLQLKAQGSLAEPSKNSSSELVGQLTKGLTITRPQARGGAGTLFALAKTRLSAEEFSKVSAAVPGMNGLLKTAPPLTDNSELSSLEFLARWHGPHGRSCGSISQTGPVPRDGGQVRAGDDQICRIQRWREHCVFVGKSTKVKSGL
jgi:hypothetical protein